MIQDLVSVLQIFNMHLYYSKKFPFIITYD